MGTKLDDYIWLTSSQAAGWLMELSHDHRPVLQQLTRLRKQLPETRARLVVEQAELRRRATGKFGEWAEQMFFTDIGLQQTTDRWIAAHKAAHFPLSSTACDLCCGIGGDLQGLANRGNQTEETRPGASRTTNGRTIGWDLAPPMALMAGINVRVGLENIDSQVAETRTGDVQSLALPAGALWHLDPDRRYQGQRSIRVEMHHPGPGVVARLRKTHPEGAVKLAPACQVPEDWADSAELEWISHARECRQLVAWFGDLAACPGQRRATILAPSQAHTRPQRGQQETCVGSQRSEAMVSHSLVGQAGRLLPSARTLGPFLFDPDPAVLAANLLGELGQLHGLSTLAAGGAYLTADHPVDDPLLTCFEVLEQFPLRVRPLTKLLASRDIGRLEIKKRGVDLDPSLLRRQLKLRGSQSATLLLARLGQREVAILAQRV